jgi:hypothetical protein
MILKIKDSKLFNDTEQVGEITGDTITFEYDALVKMLLSQTKLFRDRKLGTGGTEKLIEESGEVMNRTYDTELYMRSEIEGLEFYIQNLRKDNELLKQAIKAAGTVHQS